MITKLSVQCMLVKQVFSHAFIIAVTMILERLLGP